MAARHKGVHHMSKAEKDYHENYFEYFGEEEPKDDDDTVECVSWCGNPDYPKCMDSCELWDD